jgi:hypothetical protein
VHFDYSSLFSDVQVEKVEIKKKIENLKSHLMKTKQSAMKMSQIRRRIELCLRYLLFFHFIFEMFDTLVKNNNKT